MIIFQKKTLHIKLKYNKKTKNCREPGKGTASSYTFRTLRYRLSYRVFQH